MPSLQGSPDPKVGDVVWWCLEGQTQHVARSATVVLLPDATGKVVARTWDGRHVILERLTEVFTTEREAVDHKYRKLHMDSLRDLANHDDLVRTLKVQRRLLKAKLKRFEELRAERIQEPGTDGGAK